MARPKRNNTRNSQSKDVASLPLQQDSESEEVVEDNDNEEEEEEEEENNKKKQADNSKKQSSRNDASKPKRRTNQKPRGPGYSSEETDILLTSIQDVLPIGPLDWEKVVQMHTDQFPGMGRISNRSDASLTNFKRQGSQLEIRTVLLQSGQPREFNAK